MKNIIINCDDFGLTKGVNHAIIDAFKFKTLSSTTMIVNAPEVKHAVELYKINPTLGVGLHFNLTFKNPLTKMSLVDKDNKFLKQNKLYDMDLTLFIGEIELELQAQYDEFIRLTGKKPTHIDSHHHIHLKPELKNIFINFKEKNDILCRGLEDNIKFSCNYYKNVSFSDFKKELDNLCLTNAQKYEFSCHIGYVDQPLLSLSNYNLKRSEELEVLLSCNTKEYLKKYKLVTY